MKMHNVNRAFFLTVTTALSMVIGLGFWWSPKKIRTYAPQNDDLLESFSFDDKGTVTHSMENEGDGVLLLNGEDCYFEINNFSSPSETVVLRFKYPLENQTQFIVTADNGKSDWDEESNWKYTYGEKYTDYVCIHIGQADYTRLRIRPNNNIQVDTIEMHSKEPVCSSFKRPYAPKYYFLGVLSGVLLALAIAFLEFRWSLANRLMETIKRDKRFLLENAVVLFVLFVIALAIHLVLCGATYTFVLPMFIVTAGYSFYLVLRSYKSVYFDFEKTFFLLLLTTGMCMMACCWPNVSWDAYMHFNSSLESTKLYGTVGITDAELIIGNQGMMPDLRFSELVAYLNQRGEIITGWLNSNFHIYRFPAALFLNFADFLGCSAYAAYFAGRIGQIVTYALCGYFGIKRLHSGKLIYAVICALPVNLFLASNYSYDYFTTAFLMLGMAYFVGMCQEPDEIVNYKDAIIMLTAFVLGCTPKQIYLPIMLFAFLMPLKKLQGKKKEYYFLCVLAVFVALGLFALASYRNMTGGGDPRAGLGEVDPMAQLSNILAHPIWYAGMLSRYLLHWPFQKPIGTFFAYLGAGVGNVILVILLAVVMLIDKKYDDDAFSIPVRLYSVLHFVGVSALVATALYLVFTPVKYDRIVGAQPRYMLPLVYPLCAVIAGKGIKIKESVYSNLKIVTLSIVFFINYYNIFLLMLPMTLH